MTVMRLLIQQASWCCRPEPGRLGSPRRGSECPVIDQFSLSVHAGPGQRSGGDGPGGHSHRARGCRWTATSCKALRGRHPPGLAGPAPPPGIPSPHPSPCACGISLQATSFWKPAGLSQPEPAGRCPHVVGSAGWWARFRTWCRAPGFTLRCRIGGPLLYLLCCFLVGQSSCSWGLCG